MTSPDHCGSCLCGAVTFSVASALPDADACHCSQCRKQSGHFWASVDVPVAALAVQESGSLCWYQSSEKVRRGFCKICGSSLFWHPVQRDSIAVALGAFDGPTGITLHSHIFVADKGDYYTIGDNIPQKD